MFGSDENDRSGTEQATRRRVLRSAAAGGLSVGAVGTASATSGLSTGEIEQRLGEYRDVNAVRARVADETALLETVAAAGYIDSPTVDALGVETLGAPAGPTDAEVGVTVQEIENEQTAALTVRKPVEGGRLVLGVRPDVDQSFAVFEPDEGDGEVIAGDVTTSTTCVDCTGISCLGCTVICGPAGATCTYPTKEPKY